MDQHQNARQVSPRPALGWRTWAVLAVSLAARALMFAYRYQQYLNLEAMGGDGLTAFGGSDVRGWLGMAYYLFRQRGLAYGLMGARPPLFPLTVAVVYALGQGELVAAGLQTLFGALTPVVGLLLAYNLFSRSPHVAHPRRLAFLAGLGMALDPASVSASASLMGEPLFNLAFTLLLLHLARYSEHERWADIALAGLWLAVAMLTRTTAVYLWLTVPLILIPLVRRWWRPALALAAVGLAVYVGWSTRNLVYEDQFIFTKQSNFSLLFMRAASAEHLATGATVDDLYVGYVRELYQSAGDAETAEAAEVWMIWNFLSAPTPELYAKMGQMARERLIAYWPYAIGGTAVGAWRVFGQTTTLPRWFTPIELLYHAVLYSLTALGAWRAFRLRDWPLLMIAGVPILYVTGLTLISQVSGMDTRMRTPISVPIILFAAYGAVLLTMQKNHSSKLKLRVKL